MDADVIRLKDMANRPPLAEGLLEQRLRWLADPLDEAQVELESALLAGDAEAMRRSARRLASVGWLMYDAVDRYERGLPQAPARPA